jgi:hypothetical protein
LFYMESILLFFWWFLFWCYGITKFYIFIIGETTGNVKECIRTVVCAGTFRWD